MRQWGSDYYSFGRTEEHPAYLRTDLPRPFRYRYMIPAGKQLKADYQWEAKSQWAPRLKLVGDLKISVRFGTKRKADLDNFNKLWQDALTGIVYEDDSQIAELHLYRDYDKPHPRIEVTLQ